MKRILLLMTLATLPIWHGSGQLLAGDECRLIDWDTVTGGSHIMSFFAAGVCEYEVDTENGSQPAFLQSSIPNLPSTFEASREHEVNFRFAGNRLNNDHRGHFTIMALNAAGTNDPLFAVNISWSGTRQSKEVLVLDGNILPELQGNPWQTQSSPPKDGPVTIHEGFDDWIEVTVRFTESSGPGLDDGFIELWVNGFLEASWIHLDLDWSNQLTPDSVSYGVVKILERQTRGSLRIAHLRPGPFDFDF